MTKVEVLGMLSTVALLGLSFDARSAAAATINVSSGCSVTNAIASLNAGRGIGGCVISGTGAVTIRVPTGTFTVSAANTTISRSVTIAGAGTSSTTLSFTNTSSFANALIVDGGAAVTMTNLTLRGGSGNLLVGLSFANGSGTLSSVRVTSFGVRGITNFGAPLSLNLCTVENNGRTDAFWGGGGLYVQSFGAGVTQIDRSTIRNNHAWSGGGIYLDGNGGTTLRVTRSLIASNTASEQGGGLYSNGQPDLDNDTFSGNSATDGGGIYHASGENEFDLKHCTLAFNVAEFTGGGLAMAAASTSIIFGNIFAQNRSNASADSTDVLPPPGESSGSCFYNLIMVSSTPFQNWCPADQGNRDGNPLLSPLANSGGATLTHAISSTSPARDAIPLTMGFDTEDQRGFPRPRGNGFDMGAFEIQ